MNAREAQRLEVGEMIQCAFGTSTRRARITKIAWPYFHVYAILTDGREARQKTLYRSIHANSPDARAFGK